METKIKSICKKIKKTTPENELIELFVEMYNLKKMNIKLFCDILVQSSWFYRVSEIIKSYLLDDTPFRREYYKRIGYNKDAT